MDDYHLKCFHNTISPYNEDCDLWQSNGYEGVWIIIFISIYFLIVNLEMELRRQRGFANIQALLHPRLSGAETARFIQAEH